MKKNILITGSSGFCGSFLANELKNYNDFEIYTTSRKNIATDNHIKHDFLEPAPENLFPERIDCIIHCASEVLQSSTDFKIIHNNLLICNNVLKLALSKKIRTFVNFSSISIYGVKNVTKVNEDFSPQPITSYGLSKLFAEFFCDMLIRNHANLINLRLGYIIGKNLPARYFLSKFKENILNNTNVTLLNPARTKFCFIDLYDIGKICKIIIDGNYSGTFNVVNDEFPSVREVFTEIKKYIPSLNSGIKEQFDKNKESYTRFSNQKIKQELKITFIPLQNSFKNIFG